MVLTNRDGGITIRPDMATLIKFDAERLASDVASRGWLPRDLARAAGVSDMTVSRILNGTRCNPRTWDRVAKAMGYSVRRYLRREVA
jgi:hypothetical protein